MISTMAQLLILLSKRSTDKTSITLPPSNYRPFCSECNDEGRDARLPCEGH
jgi:RNase P subunit RPR2